MDKGQAITSDVPTLKVNIKKDAAGKVKVDLRAVVTPELLQQLQGFGGEIIFSSQKFSSITVNLPLLALEQVAGITAVKTVKPWIEPVHNSRNSATSEKSKSVSAKSPKSILYVDKSIESVSAISNNFPDFVTRSETVTKLIKEALGLHANNNQTFTGTIISEADVTHKVALARSVFGTTGSGVKIGVLSDGVDGYADSQASDDLPAVITILPGQEGSGSEGRAMIL